MTAGPGESAGAGQYSTAPAAKLKVHPKLCRALSLRGSHPLSRPAFDPLALLLVQLTFCVLHLSLPAPATQFCAHGCTAATAGRRTCIPLPRSGLRVSWWEDQHARMGRAEFPPVSVPAALFSLRCAALRVQGVDSLSAQSMCSMLSRHASRHRTGQRGPFVHRRDGTVVMAGPRRPAGRPTTATLRWCWWSTSLPKKTVRYVCPRSFVLRLSSPLLPFILFSIQHPDRQQMAAAGMRRGKSEFSEQDFRKHWWNHVRAQLLHAPALLVPLPPLLMQNADSPPSRRSILARLLLSRTAWHCPSADGDVHGLQNHGSQADAQESPGWEHPAEGCRFQRQRHGWCRCECN